MKRVVRRTAILPASVWLVALVVVVSGCAAPTPASPVSGPSSAPLSDPATSTPPIPPGASTPVPTVAASTLTHRAQVDFGKPVEDAYLQTILDKHEAMMVTAYLTTTGFFGAHRGTTPTDPGIFIAQARAETLEMFSNGEGGGITTRAKDFVGNHTAQDLDSDAEALKRARSLLDLHSRLEAARSDSADGAPLIHAVEVHGSEAQLRLLGQGTGVVGFEIAVVGDTIHWSRPPLAGVYGTASPMPRSTALSYTTFAEDTSHSAIPRDLNSVTSLGFSRPDS